MLKIGVRHVTKPPIHSIGNICFSERELLIYQWLLDMNSCTEPLAFPIFEIVVKHGPVDFDNFKPIFRFTSKSLE